MNKQLSNDEILFIRAAKKATGRESLRYIEKIYLRFYMMKKVEPVHLCHIFLRIIDKTDKPIELSRFIDELSPDKYWLHPEVVYDNEIRNYWGHILNVLVNHVRFMSVDDMKNAGFISGVKWRRRGISDLAS